VARIWARTPHSTRSGSVRIGPLTRGYTTTPEDAERGKPQMFPLSRWRRGSNPVGTTSRAQVGALYSLNAESAGLEWAARSLLIVPARQVGSQGADTRSRRGCSLNCAEPAIETAVEVRP
jgi:hypothetical protein